jgi:hypothetical protein
MQIILTGFTQDNGFRVFAFERVGEDRVRTKCTVKADLALSRRYGIPLQELPLLCRGLLDRNNESGARSLTFTEAEMSLCASERAAARERVASKRRPPHRPSGENLGAAWRVQHL